MLQTAHGSLTVGLDAQPGQTLLIRGGTSSVGMATAVLAKDRGLTVLSTTRRPERVDALEAIGVDHVIVDDGEIARAVREIAPDGVDVALELVGTPTLPGHAARHASPRRRLLHRDAEQRVDRPRLLPDRLPPDRRAAHRLQRRRRRPPRRRAAVASSTTSPPAGSTVPIDRTYTLDEIATAHADMEAGNAIGKLVVLV